MNVHAKPAKQRAAAAPGPEASPIAPDCAGRTSTPSIGACGSCWRSTCPPPCTRISSRTSRASACSPAAGSTSLPASPTRTARAASARPLRARRGLDRVPPRLPRDGGDRLRRLPVPRHEPPRRRARASMRRCRRSPNTPSSTCSCRASSASCARSASPTRRSTSSASMRASELKDYLLPRMLVGRSRRVVEGHAVHDREGRRIGHRPARDGGAQRGRHLAAPRREVVLLARRRRRGPDPRAAGRRARRHRGPRPVRLAAPARGRHAQQLSDRAPQGQARHALDGLRRDPPRRRGRLSGRPARPGPQADDGPGQPVAPVARGAGRRHDAPLPQRGAERWRAIASPSASPSSSIRWRGGS